MAYVDVLASRALRTAAGVELRLRSPLSRSVTLAMVSLDLALDGVEVEPERVRFCVIDRDFALDELPRLDEEWWFVLDAARVRVAVDEPAESHDVEVLLSIRPPFLATAIAVPVRAVERRRVAIEAA